MSVPITILYVYINIHAMELCRSVSVYVHTYTIDTDRYMCTYVCTYVLCTYVLGYVCTYICIYVCMYVYRYLCVYITLTLLFYLKVLLEYGEWTVSVEGRRSTIRWPKCWECTCHITGELADVTKTCLFIDDLFYLPYRVSCVHSSLIHLNEPQNG